MQQIDCHAYEAIVLLWRYPSLKLISTKQKSVPVYYAGQDTTKQPDHYITKTEAKTLTCGKQKAQVINRGKAILLKGPRTFKQATRDSIKSRWVVTNQTPRKKPNGPGFPRWTAV